MKFRLREIGYADYITFYLICIAIDGWRLYYVIGLMLVRYSTLQCTV